MCLKLDPLGDVEKILDMQLRPLQLPQAGREQLEMEYRPPPLEALLSITWSSGNPAPICTAHGEEDCLSFCPLGKML